MRIVVKVGADRVPEVSHCLASEILLDVEVANDVEKVILA